ncbi:helix-turn-helix domain-containing protein [Ciceribacter thiooxidans]|uniref:Helix-turn-helix domain-containing protein n=1 Tax=Ciceribacter thiooxidans TaxID=1969821 RepID=A0ABV7I6G0_9HYPH|nr:helix-turn-helix domain-containing protein [Ciceribacter thiooxidans]
MLSQEVVPVEYQPAPQPPDPAALLSPAERQSLRFRCMMVRQVVAELLAFAGDEGRAGRDRRRSVQHIRQISMYVSHVVLQIPMQHVAIAFGADRSTVSHACRTVEERRENRAYDDFVGAAERLTASFFLTAGGPAHG